MGEHEQPKIIDILTIEPSVPFAAYSDSLDYPFITPPPDSVFMGT